MTKTTRTLLILLIFAFAMKEACSSSLQTQSNTFAPENGEIPILEDYHGLYLEVDLDYKADQSRYLRKMNFVLSRSQTMLVTKECLSFGTYDCSAHNCKPTDEKLYFFYPSFYGEAQVATAELFLDYSSWILKTDVYLALRCWSGYQENLSGDYPRIGVIGLGTAGKASESFIGSKIFSIFLNTTQSKLLFRYDESLASNKKAVVPTDANWQIPFERDELVMKMGTYSVPSTVSGKIIFDPNYRYLEFPVLLFYTIGIYFNGSDIGIHCPARKSPMRHCTGNIWNPPSVYLIIGGKSIEIPPEVYVESIEEDELNTRFAIADNSDNAIILSKPFMNYYYTVFDATQNKNTVSLYVKGSNGNPLFLILLGVLIAILVIAAIVFAILKMKKKRQAQLNPSTDGSLMTHNRPES